MPIQTFETQIPATAAELYAWHIRPGALQRLTPPWQALTIDSPAPVENGSVVELRLRKGPLSIRCRAEHRDVEPGRGFTDEMTALPFARWVHRHEFEDHQASSLLRDRIDYRLAGGPLGRWLAGPPVARDIEATFAFRHRRTARDLARHQKYAHERRMRIAVSGAGGLLGGNLVSFLTTGGHRVVRLARKAGQPGAVVWTPDLGLAAPRNLGPVDAVVHLAGESIAGGRWTSERKERILASRVDGTRNLVRSLVRLERPPKTLVCASAVGFYGSRGDAILDEGSAPGEGFLAEVCRGWEEAAAEAAAEGLRVVMVRFGIVLTPAGGALAKMLPPFRLGAGGRLGDGRQFMSWVSIDDAVGAVHQALFDERLAGPVNVVAPRPVTNAEFTRALGRVLRRPTIVPVPAAGARLAFGAMADEMLLSSTRVRPRKLETVGYEFNDTDLEPTLAHLLGKAEPQ